jgi:hypothetical protein
MSPPEPAKAAAAALAKFEKAKGGVAGAAGGSELLASGSDDFTLFLWKPGEGKQARLDLTCYTRHANSTKRRG